MNASKLLAGGLLLGMGLATGGATVSAAAAGVGINWLGEGAAGLWSGLAAPPETALGRAYTGAIRKGVAELKARYRQGVDPRGEPAAFDLVAACADHVAGAEFPAGAVDVDGAQRGLAGALAALLHGHDPRQVEFLQRELLPACAAAFQTQLLKDDDAWRAFHGLILQGLARSMGDLMAQMAEFPKFMAQWGRPDEIREMLRRLSEESPTRFPIPAPQSLVLGNVYQAGRDQHFYSAHAEGGGAATVINNFGGSSPAPAPPTPATLLFLAANPLGTERLRLDEEARQVTAALRQGGRRLDLAQAWAVRGEELLAALLHHRPVIVHFAGHGDEDCLILEGADGQPAVLAGEALAALLGAAGGVRCVVLNACWSDAMAEALLRVVPCVVGMAGDLDDRAAIAFAAGFYQMLGLGKSVAGALAGGHAQILAEGLPATFIGQVRLRTAPGVDLSSMCIP